MPSSTEYYSLHCDHCDEWTLQEVYSSGHERDSSADWRRCVVCNWEYSGLTGKWCPPALKERD